MPKISAIGKLIKSGESETVEFKKSTGEWKEIIETISAFANTRGGIILVGVDNKGNLPSVSIGKTTVEDLTNKILTNIEPKFYPEITVETVKDKKIICIKVEMYPYDVVLAFRKPFKRIGKNTVKMGKDEYKRKILEIYRKDLYFDGQICTETSFSDIDTKKIETFVRKARKARKLEIEVSASKKEILRKLKLMKGDDLTNACVLLFGKNPQDSFTQAGVKCIRFKGTDVTADMLDFKEIEGDLFTQIDEAEKFIFSNISLKTWIEDRKLERQEKWEYPPKAIREALANAIVHRDYRSSGKVQVRIFDDRIEFWNPGKLPTGWTVQTLKEEHTSEPFNPLLARMFFWVRLIEGVGTGTNKIINRCKEWGLPEPEFSSKENRVMLRFRKDIYTEEYLKSAGLNERQIKAVMYVKEKEKITNKEYQRVCQTSERTATRDLKSLVKHNIFKQAGITGKGTYYTLMTPQRRHKDAKEAIMTPQRRQKIRNE